MRTVVGNISTIEQDYSFTEVEFILSNKYGNAANPNDIQGSAKIKQTRHCDRYGNFRIDLIETEKQPIDLCYLMKTKNTNTKIFVWAGESEINFLQLLKPEPKVDTFIVKQNGKHTIDERFINMIDKSFVNENPFMIQKEIDLKEALVDFADNKNDSKAAKVVDRLLMETLRQKANPKVKEYEEIEDVSPISIDTFEEDTIADLLRELGLDD